MKIVLAILMAFFVFQSYGQTFEELTQLAIKSGKEKKYPEAISLYKKALQLDNENHHIFNKLSLIYFSLSKYDSSIYYSDLVIKKKPSDTMALYYRGHSYMALNEFEKALDDFKKSFEQTNKSNPHACFNIGKCYSEIGNYTKAIEYYLLTLKLEPNDKYSFYELGHSYASLTNPDKNNALLYYNKAIEQDSNYYAPYFNRGLLYATQYKDLKNAHIDLEKSIQIRPKNKLSYLYNARLYRKEQEFGKAKDMCNILVDLYPDYADAYFERALIWYDIGILNMVCKDLEKAESLGQINAGEYKKRVCK